MACQSVVAVTGNPFGYRTDAWANSTVQPLPTGTVLPYSRVARAVAGPRLQAVFTQAMDAVVGQL